MKGKGPWQLTISGVVARGESLEAKVGDLRCELEVQEDVGCLEVPVEHRRLCEVDVLHAAGDASGDLHPDVEGEVELVVEHVPYGAILEVLHDDQLASSVKTGPHDRTQVRVSHANHDSDFRHDPRPR
eukprot:318133-Hanusia_phi.AAC.5